MSGTMGGATYTDVENTAHVGTMGGATYTDVENTAHVGNYGRCDLPGAYRQHS